MALDIVKRGRFKRAFWGARLKSTFCEIHIQCSMLPATLNSFEEIRFQDDLVSFNFTDSEFIKVFK